MKWIPKADLTLMMLFKKLIVPEKDGKIVFIKCAKADGRRRYGINKMPRQIRKTY
jgi:hypothetical protein